MAVVEIWGGNDDYIYPQQNKNVDTEKKRSYLAVYDLAARSIKQIGDKEVPTVTLGNEGNSKILLGESDVKHRKMITWDTQNFSDVFVFDLSTNTRKLVQENLKGMPTFLRWLNTYIGIVRLTLPGLPTTSRLKKLI